MKATTIIRWLVGLLVSLALLSVLPLSRLLLLLLSSSSSEWEDDLTMGVVPDATIAAVLLLRQRPKTTTTASNHKTTTASNHKTTTASNHNNSHAGRYYYEYDMTGNMTFAQRHAPHLFHTSTTTSTSTSTTTTSSCPPRLEFLHIPKSGGTTIERAGTEQAHLAWGACHFHFRRPQRRQQRFPHKGKAQQSQQSQEHEQRWDLCPSQITSPIVPLQQWPREERMSDLWHYPLHWLFFLSEEAANHHHNTTTTTTTTIQQSQQPPKGYPLLPANPYHNVATATATTATGTTRTRTNPQSFRSSTSNNSSSSSSCRPQDQALHFFAVIRNPYARALSEYYYQAGMAMAKHPQRLQNANFMNQWLASKLKDYYQHIRDMDNNNNNNDSSTTTSWGARLLHWIPQSEYIWDDQGRRKVAHILRFEYLTHDFDELMRMYNLTIDLTLLATEKSGRIPSTSRFGPQHMNAHVRRALETHFAADFALGGYSFFVPAA